MKYEVKMPDWVAKELDQLPSHIPQVEDRMRAIIRFSGLNVRHASGGPFAAGVFEKQSGKIISIGVNRVVPENNSTAHAEMVAIALGQHHLQTHDLGGQGLPDHQLVVNGRPCSMCFGALPWSGIRSLVVGATGEQIESITGFDEGPIHPKWKDELIQRGIEVIEDVLMDEACQVLRDFASSGQPVYNGRSG